MSQTVLALAVTWVVGGLIERLAGPRHAGWPSLTSLPARLAALTLLAAFWLGIFDRPWLAATATGITLAVLVTISVRKRQLIGEPLVFSDFGLLRMAVRHPDLYYVDILSTWPVRLGFAALGALILLWLWLEPPLLSGFGIVALLVSVALLVALAWSAARRPAMAGWLRTRVPGPDIAGQLERWGLLLTLAVHALRWRGDLARSYPMLGPTPAGINVTGAAPDLVVVVQIESFMDPVRRLAEPTLPGLSAARTRARLHGTLRVPAHGAYTMRSEFAVLSGLSQGELGFRGFDPYLSTVASGAAAAPTLASRLQQRGYATLFIHPFRPGFFDRADAMVRLGFDSCLWEHDLTEAERTGPYIGDPALAAHVLEACRAASPTFVMAVTMENHGPWPAGRLPGETEARDQYLAHLANSDRAITILIDGLSDHPGRVLLCLYGDHPPILPELDAEAVPETDYVILELGAGARVPVPQHLPLTADELGRVLMALSVPGGSAGAATA